MSMWRFTRLTQAFSKKVENLIHAVASHFMYYNCGRIHQTLRVTPAIEAGWSDRVWTVEGMVTVVKSQARRSAQEAGGMNTLKVSNGYGVILPNLGKTRDLPSLSERRITKTVRDELRKWYGPENVEVSCDATFHEGRWRGRCKIWAERFDYTVSAN